MIYLIDDKIDRQNDFGWNKNKIDFYEDILISVSSYAQIEKREERELIFSDGNILLFHESFFDLIENKHIKDSNEIRNDLNKFVTNNKNSKVVFFSGSYNSREPNLTGGSMPVSVLYQNLDVFLQKHKTDGSVELKYLFFGETPEIENELLQKLERSNSLLIDELTLSKIDTTSNNLLITGNGQGFPVPFKKSVNFTFFNKYTTDSGMSSKIDEWFFEKEYDNIFIPLCLGATLSDFNGLRLALHIRCSGLLNSLKPIYIYSFLEDMFSLFSNEYFDVLKTKNIQLIDCSKRDFQKSIDIKLKPFVKEKLPIEINKIKLSPPKNYIDSHSIVNEWAIYRWSKTINVSDEKIEAIENKVESNLYFKYLKTIYPILDSEVIDKQKLKINYSGNPKVLYIDDEVEKGWGEIFAHLFDDENEIYFDYLVEDFKKISQEQLIKLSIQKIEEDNIDLVLLDFRLLSSDFNEENINEITGVKLLEEIKKLNPGIQVIIFSATNKIWNLQKLQELGADNFVIKESPENSIDAHFTANSISNFKLQVEKSIKLKFKKQLFKKLKSVRVNLINCDYIDDTEYAEFINNLKTQVNLIYNASKNISFSDKSTLDIVFLNCYNFLELFKSYYLRELNYKLLLGIEELEMNRYRFVNGQVINEGVFVRNNRNDNPSWFNSLSGLFIDYFSICDVNGDDVTQLHKVKEKRNNYIHGSKNNFDHNELLIILNLMVKASESMKE